MNEVNKLRVLARDTVASFSNLLTTRDANILFEWLPSSFSNLLTSQLDCFQVGYSTTVDGSFLQFCVLIA